ncbi:PX-associated-domain-containing protein [Thermothelomyces heterothallicus CBS 202.75]|uniref:PX-associated-domain-containing protein n=1 Tax=Thermothelomyces heterothallicus CBS 202.75 TaxID=1149848 RepID=UPI003743DA43
MEGQIASSTLEHASQCPSATPLTAAQLHAVLDILTHHQTYAEVESFKDPGTISEYGYPFTRHHQQPSSDPSYARDSVLTPLLAGVLRSIVLPLPGIRNLPPEFWHVQFQSILEKLAEAELSESYDKGVLGTRKTLATAVSALHEAVSRGILGGVSDDAGRNFYGEYDRSKATDLVRAWEDGVRELVYGDLIEELFTCAAEKQSLEEHSAGVRAAADYVIIHLATLIHHIFIMSPEGPYLLKLLENVHRLLPYSMVKHTLRIGNAATMLNGMMRLLLAKAGVGAILNWVGLTQNADDGMNLLQRIIWLVLTWDASDFRKSAEAIEKAKGCSKEQLAAIREYLNKSRAEHDEIRKASAQRNQSMVEIILERSNPELLASLTESQQSQCSEYLSALLEARDRDEIINTLCRQSPDFFTQAIKDAVASFEPMIRAIHMKVDLHEHVSAGEAFLTEFINISRTRKNNSGLLGSLTSTKAETSETRIASVEDYVLLLRNNRHLLYNWLHQLASQCPEVCDEFRAWAKETIKVFRRPVNPEYPRTALNTEDGNRPGAAGALSRHLQHLFATLPASTRSRILPAIDAHAAYLSALEDLSLKRMQRILDNMVSITNTATTTSAAAATTPSAPSNPSSTATAPAAPTSYLIPSRWSRPGRSTPRSPSPNSVSLTSPPNGTNATEAESKKRSFSGPGMYLARWQQLLDDAVIGPASSKISGGTGLRSGRDVKGVLARGKTGSDGDGAKAGSDSGGVSWELMLLAKIGKEGMGMEEEPRAVDVWCVVEALGEGFKALVRNLVKGRDMNGA